MELVLLTAIGVLCFFNLTCALNLRRLPRLQPRAWEAPSAPKVSVLIPARNEEQRIAPCVRSLCRQQYPNYEVLVLDDESTDGTAAVLEQLQAEFPERLRVIRGAPLPKGWVGKSWACHQLAQQAQGEWLFFTDADTVHTPLCLASVMAAREQYGWRFLTVMPDEELGTLSEQLIIPLLAVFYFGYVPDRWRRLFPRFNAAGGQALLIEGTLYWQLGGHAAVRSELAEDLALGQRAAALLGSAPVAEGTQLLRCRMYTSAAEVIAGFSKNMYPAMGYRWWVLLGFVVHLLWLFVLPPAAAVAGLLSGELLWSLLGGMSYGLATVLRWQVTAAFRFPRTQVWLFPLSALFAAFIGVNSFRWSLQGRLRWKGRTYSPA